MAIRKDANTLSNAERLELSNAIVELKRRGIYDRFVLRHANANSRAIHRSPAFLPWHRRFIWDFESELQRVSGNPDLGLPYWNWPEGGANASMWDDNLLGGDGNPVTQVVNNGPFRSGEWTIINSNSQQAGPLTRAFGRESWATSLPTLQQIQEVLSFTPYDAANWNENVTQSFRNQLEGFRGPNLHNRGHGWVGGSMLPMTSPNDPIFFMHHCMVDKLWYEWQLRFPGQGYLPVNNGPFGQNETDPMDSTPASPIGARPLDVLDSRVLNIEYDQLLPGTPDPGTGDNTSTELIINATATNAQISAPGEEDKYHFEVTEFSPFNIETSGASDTTLTLFGPDNETDQIAFDDDGGNNFNSLISRSLPSGSYFMSVRLFNAAATGNYQISVTSPEGTGSGTTIPEIPVNGSALNAEISNAEEIDIFSFTASTQGLYTIETTGITDTYMNLFGPNSQSLPLDENDDSGINRNSLVQVQLTAGEYFVQIRHFSPTGVGAYQIRVSV